MQKDYIDEEKLKVKPEDEKGPELRGDKRILKETHCCVALWLIILFVCSIYLLLIKKNQILTIVTVARQKNVSREYQSIESFDTLLQLGGVNPSLDQ